MKNQTQHCSLHRMQRMLATRIFSTEEPALQFLHLLCRRCLLSRRCLLQSLWLLCLLFLLCLFCRRGHSSCSLWRSGFLCSWNIIIIGALACSKLQTLRKCEHALMCKKLTATKLLLDTPEPSVAAVLP